MAVVGLAMTLVVLVLVVTVVDGATGVVVGGRG